MKLRVIGRYIYLLNMGATLLVLFIALVAGVLALPLFETTFIVLLLSPIFASVVGLVLPLNRVIFLTIFAFTFLACYVNVNRGPIKRPKPCFDREGAIAIGLFALIFQILYGLNLTWPDFVSIGERLRDYAILAAVTNDPIKPDEPWLVGVTMQYYLYWYRFGHMLATVLDLKVWQLYHILGAFTFSLYFSSTAFLFLKHFRVRLLPSVLCATLICFGSNVSGILYFLAQDSNWWGPSRVIQGAITEFPVWSYLLGDLHPHYLNLSLLPVLLSTFLTINASLRYKEEQALFVFALVFVPLGWLYSSSNPWELPVWLIFGAIWAFLLLLNYRGKIRGVLFSAPWAETFPLGLALIMFGFVIIGTSFFEAAHHLPQKDYALAYVQGEFTPTFITDFLKRLGLEVMIVPGTTREELLLHWGFPLALIAVSATIIIASREILVGALALAVICSLTPQALPIILMMIALALSLFYLDARVAWRRDDPLPISAVLIHALGISSLLVILFPEFLFLNDSYGGENERMNTIFKFYSAAWFMLHAYAFALAVRAYDSLPMKLRASHPAKVVLVATCVLLLGFAIRTIGYRPSNARTVEPRERGLSEIERTYPGAAQAIEALTNAPPGVVLEAQGPPYSATTHVSTIAGKQAFLGWTNHVGLLIGLHDEIRAREEFTEKVYHEADCAKRATMLREKHIRYLVVGPLESAKYQNLSSLDFACLSSLVTAGGYRIFEVT